MSSPESYLSEQAVANLLGVEIKTLRNARSLGRGPLAIETDVGRGRLFLRSDVSDYLNRAREASIARRARKVGDDHAANVAPTPFTPPSDAERAGDKIKKKGRGRPKGSLTRRWKLDLSMEARDL